MGVVSAFRKRKPVECKMVSLAEYVDSLSTSLRELDEASTVHVTVGNESCDLDSIACALSHAHHLAQKGGISLPLLQCTRADFTLRKDAMWLFQHLNLDPTKLLYSEDVKGALGKVGSVKVTLVDHTHLTGVLSELSSVEVVEVIDHHMGEEEEEEQRGHRLLKEGVGSCSTLVAEQLLGGEQHAVQGPVATLLLAAILVDTVDLSPDKGRVTEKDTAIAEQLLPLSLLPRAELYHNLSTARFSVSSLTTPQLLERDFKVTEVSGHRLGFSSITCLVTDLLARESVVDDMSTFCQSQDLSVLLLLGISVSGEATCRQVAIYQPQLSTSPDLADSISSLLEAQQELQCEHRPAGNFPGHILEQGNVSKSRKHILPLVVNFVSSVEQETDHTVNEPSGEPVPVDQPNIHPNEASGAAVLSVGEPVVTAAATPEEQGTKKKASLIPEYTLKEESADIRSHRHVSVGGEEMTIDMLAIEPYKKIIQHGGYTDNQRRAIVIISACYLPPRSIPDYQDIIHQLFFYVLSVVERLVVDDYVIVYLHSGAPHHSMPSVPVFHKFYKMVDRRLRKQLMHLYIVHPTFWVKSMLRLARPFISGKFYRKVHFIRSLAQLTPQVALEPQLIPAPVQRVDAALQPRPQQPQQRYQPAQD